MLVFSRRYRSAISARLREEPLSDSLIQDSAAQSDTARRIRVREGHSMRKDARCWVLLWVPALLCSVALPTRSGAYP